MSAGDPVLIVGCGYVGRALAARLVADGQQVVGVSRTPSDLPAGVRPVAADVTRPATLAALPADARAVVYAVSAAERTDAAYRAAYVDGPRHVASALAARGAPLRLLLYVSSTAVYAQSDGSVVDEASPTEPREFGGRRLLEGERVAIDGPFRGIAVRLGGIYGPGRTRFVERVLAGATGYPADPPLYSNRIHRDDAAGALAHLLARPPRHDVVLGVDDAPAPLDEVAAWIAARAGVAVSGPRAPEPGSRALRSNKRCSNARLRALGFEPSVPTFREGYAPLVDGLRR